MAVVCFDQMARQAGATRTIGWLLASGSVAAVLLAYKLFPCAVSSPCDIIASVIRALKTQLSPRTTTASRGGALQALSSEKRAGLESLIGNTPLIELQSLSEATCCRILAKVEYMNPGMSAKDRVALRVLDEAEDAGMLAPGGVVVEGTAGSTGISLALLCAARGYGCRIVMPDDMAAEKAHLLRVLGCDVIQVAAVSIVNQGHCCRVAQAMAEATAGAFFANQFENLANFRAHYATTGPEIWQQARGDVDGFVMAAGTGGTIAGVGTFLREQNPNVVVAMPDPHGSALYHKVMGGVLYAPQQREQTLQRNRYDTVLEGVGLDRLTANFSQGLQNIDVAYRVDDQTAINMAHYLLHHEGLFIGSSSALNCVGAVKLARELGPGHTIVTVLCDHGSRAMSKVFNREFLETHQLSYPTKQTLQSLEFIQ